ncbi:MAG: ABC transporter substrate-binding protein [Alicyclobacillus sp.]|nr:ABC transporter substrate-binding protein [Alicyclobacillus sp.]
MNVISKDGKTYTFHLRKGIKFANGDPMTAQSFIDEFERVLGKDGTVSQGEGFLDPIVVGSTAYNKAKVKPKSISGVSAPNPYTLVIHLTKPEPFFLNILAMPFFSAVDQKYIDQVGAKAFDTRDMMGTGPFEVVPKSVTPNGMVMVRNPLYWRKDQWGNRLPYLDKVTININKNGDVDSLHFQQGTTAIIGNLFQGIPSSSFPKFKTDPNLKKTLYSAPQNAVWYIGQNVKIAPFNNAKVRVALEYAINKARIIQLLNGRGQVANQPLPPGLQGYVKNMPASVNYTYNPSKAKALLAAAGYGPNKKLSITLYSQNDPDFNKIANAIAYDLQQIGVNCKIHLMDDNAFWNEAEQGKFGWFIGGWIQDFPDASDFLNTLLNSDEAPSNNMTNYSNPQVDEWLNKAQTDPNQAERWKLYEKVTIQVMKDAAWIPLYYPVAYYAAQTWVHGFYISPTLPDPLQYVWIDPGHSQG